MIGTPYLIGGVALIGALIGGAIWHDGKADAAIDAAFQAGAAKQKDADADAVAAAEAKAAAAQSALKAATAKNAATISKGTDNALQGRYTVLARSYDDLRLQWAAHRAAEGRSGAGGATGPAGAASVADDAYCAAQGWVDIQAASAIAEAADTAIAKDDAWREWWRAQEAAWPK